MYTEKTIFAIEKNNEGDKVIHFFGYGYYCECKESEPKKYRFLEYTFFCAPLKNVINFESGNEKGFSAYENEFQDDYKQYITDCTYDEMVDVITHYDNGNAPKQIKEKDIINAECGIYILVK